MATNRTFKGIAKPFGKSGHFNEPQRHAMQAKGFKTGNLANANGLMPITKPKGRLVVKRYMVFKFDDLSDKAKEKAIEEHREINVDYDWYDEDGLADFNNQDFKDAGVQPLPKDWYNRKLMPDGIHYEGVEYPAYTGLIKYNHKDIAFDLDRGQYLQLNDIKVMDDNVFRKWLHIPTPLWKKVEYRFESEREDSTKLVFGSNNQISTSEQDVLDKASEKWSEKMHEAWKNLRDDYYDRLSDERVTEALRENDYEFTEDGRIN